MGAIDFDKLRQHGYTSVDDLPPAMLADLPGHELEAVRRELPPRQVVDYGKGKLPSRAALARAWQQIDAREGLAPGTAITEAAMQVATQARLGNLSAWRESADRLDGKPQAEVAMAPGTEMAVQYVIRGPAVCKTREEFCQLSGMVVSPDVETG